jgi:hypothetical protein
MYSVARAQGKMMDNQYVVAALAKGSGGALSRPQPGLMEA